MNELTYIKQAVFAITDDYNQECEDYFICELFKCEYSFERIIKLHINREFANIFGTISSDNFNFPENFISNNEYYLFSKILVSLEEALEYYFKRASIIEDFNIDEIRIKFAEEDNYLSIKESIMACQNTFLKFLPLEKRLDFAKNSIFQCNYNSIPYDFLKEAKLNTLNFYALAYFMYIDLNNLTMEHLNFICENKFTKTLKVNPFIMHKEIVLNKINKIFSLVPSGIKKKNGKIFTELETYKRIFDVYLYMNYLLEKPYTNHKCIMWLVSRGYKYSNEVSAHDRSVDTGQYIVYIKDDKKTITRVQKIAEEYFRHNK